MEVKERAKFGGDPEHWIEWGLATWTENKPMDQKDKSIRNRYNKESGGYNLAGSSEIPWDDFLHMIHESIKRRKFSKDELREILDEVSNLLPDHL
jgi:hypothetical protein